MSENSTNDKRAHLVWCAMVALYLARQEGRIASEQQENIFLLRWLADAERQRRFSRDVASDIRWLLQQGRLLGVRAQLLKKLDYIWRSSTGNILEQSDLFRLTWGLETAKTQSWAYYVLGDKEWSGKRYIPVNPDVNAVYLPKSALEFAFTHEGRQTALVPVRITGNVGAFSLLLVSCGWQLQVTNGDDETMLAALPVPGNDRYDEKCDDRISLPSGKKETRVTSCQSKTVNVPDDNDE